MDEDSEKRARLAVLKRIGQAADIPPELPKKDQSHDLGRKLDRLHARLGEPKAIPERLKGLQQSLRERNWRRRAKLEHAAVFLLEKLRAWADPLAGGPPLEPDGWTERVIAESLTEWPDPFDVFKLHEVLVYLKNRGEVGFTPTAEGGRWAASRPSSPGVPSLPAEVEKKTKPPLPPPGGPGRGAPRRQRKREWLGFAIMKLKAHPDLLDIEVARRVGVTQSTLSRCDEYRRVASLIRNDWKGKPPPRGWKDTDGTMEAEAD